jgi:hypothetical protein
MAGSLAGWMDWPVADSYERTNSILSNELMLCGEERVDAMTTCTYELVLNTGTACTLSTRTRLAVVLVSCVIACLHVAALDSLHAQTTVHSQSPRSSSRRSCFVFAPSPLQSTHDFFVISYHKLQMAVFLPESPGFDKVGYNDFSFKVCFLPYK